MDITFWTWVPPPTKAKLLLMSAMVTLNLPIFSNDVFFVQYSYFEISFPKCNLLVTDYVYYYFNLKTSVLKYIFCVWNLLWSSFGMWKVLILHQEFLWDIWIYLNFFLLLLTLTGNNVEAYLETIRTYAMSFFQK